MSDVAVLAPVPYEHLVSGSVVCATAGKVAFGSMNWELFRKLDSIAGGEKVPVYFYASWANTTPPPLVTWRGLYVGHVEGSGAGHPQGMRYRPRTTGEYEGDNSNWAIYWEVEALLEIPIGPGQLQMDAFIGYETGKRFIRYLVPQGPILVRQV